jgi:dihydroorotate dehydrogenase electron transfer subunit
MKADKIASIKLEVAKVVESEWLTEDTCKIAVRASGICDGVSPGQFFMIKGWEGNNPLLRRPFSISNIEGNNLLFVIRTTGPGTRLIAEKDKGDSISLLGPLGKGFVIAEKVDKHILIAGGVGIAPFPLLCRTLEERGATDNVELLYGEKSASSNTDLLEARLRDEGDSTAIYACGPWAMLREIRLLVGQKRGPLQFSLESHMACGLGSCMGCVIGVKKGEKIIYQRVCRTGPVFDGREVVF